MNIHKSKNVTDLNMKNDDKSNMTQNMTTKIQKIMTVNMTKKLFVHRKNMTIKI